MSRVLFRTLLVLLLAACGAPSANLVPASTVEATVAPVPTDAPAGTPEPALPTVSVTSAPEATLPPDALPTPALSDQANAYVADASNLLQTYDEWITTLETQSVAAQQDPGLVRDDEWKQAGVVALVAIRIAAARLSQLDAGGSEAQPLADLAEQIVDETGPMATQFSAGLEEADANRIASALPHLQKIRQWIDEARTELNTLQAR